MMMLMMENKGSLRRWEGVVDASDWLMMVMKKGRKWEGVEEGGGGGVGDGGGGGGGAAAAMDDAAIMAE